MNRAIGGSWVYTLCVNLKKEIFLNFSKISFLLLLFIGASNTIFSQSKLTESNQLIKFCSSVNELSQVYSSAVDGQMQNVKSIFDGVISNQTDASFPLEKIEMKGFYRDELMNIQRIERIYTLDGAGIKEQSELVSKVKSCQREMKKVDMFNKAFADYVNGKRYQSDPDFQEGKLMYHKLDQSLMGLKADISEIQREMAVIENNSLHVILEKHKLKTVLNPMNDDLLFLTELFVNTEMKQDPESLVLQIQEKRTALVDSKEMRSKEAGYLLKDGVKADLHTNFYNRYQSALTKNEDQLKKVEELTPADLTELSALNDIVLEQLKSSFDKLKGSRSLSQLK